MALLMVMASIVRKYSAVGIFEHHSVLFVMTFGIAVSKITSRLLVSKVLLQDRHCKKFSLARKINAISGYENLSSCSWEYWRQLIAEKWLFWDFGVQWLHFVGDVDKSKFSYFKFLQDFVHSRLFKSVHFYLSYSRNNGSTFFRYAVVWCLCFMQIAYMSRSEMSSFDSCFFGPLLLITNQCLGVIIDEYLMLWFCFVSSFFFQSFVHVCSDVYSYCYTRLMASFPGQPGKPVPKW